MKTPEVMVVFGTRPEAVKVAPVIAALRRSPQLEVRVVATGQHREMLAQALEFFKIQPDVSLDIMRANQDLFDVTIRSLEQLRTVLASGPPDALMVQGDTTTACCAALAAFYSRIPVAHVEAGLRSGDRLNPYPEELNRRVISSIAEWHFAPTAGAAENLLREGADPARVFVTGNTIVDALQWVVAERQDELPQTVHGLSLSELARQNRRLVLVTCHRRESFGEDIRGVCAALRRIVEQRPDIVVAYPVHPNPNVTSAVGAFLEGHPRIVLLPPLDYLSFLTLMTHAELILTDSGGVQEEAPSFRKPVLVLRKTTERPEGLAAGVARLVGTVPETIVQEALRLLDHESERTAMMSTTNPYGDGHAAERIVDVLTAHLALGHGKSAEGTAPKSVASSTEVRR